MLWKVALTYEFDSMPPKTYRGIFAAPTLKSAARKTVDGAKTAFPRQQPTSVVILLEPQSNGGTLGSGQADPL